MWIPLLILLFVLASQANTRQQWRAQRRYRASHKPYRPAASKRAPESPPVDVSLRADAFETPTQQPFETVHAREEASMCDPSQGHREVHAAAPPIVQAPVSCDAAPVHPLSHLLEAQNLQSAILLAEILGPPGGKSRAWRRQHT